MRRSNAEQWGGRLCPAVERLDEAGGGWEVVHTDDDWSTKFSWDRWAFAYL